MAGGGLCDGGDGGLRFDLMGEEGLLWGLFALGSGGVRGGTFGGKSGKNFSEKREKNIIFTQNHKKSDFWAAWNLLK